MHRIIRPVIYGIFAASALVAAQVDAGEGKLPRPVGLTGENWQFGPLNRWAYTHLREVLPTKDIPNDYAAVISLPRLNTARRDLRLSVSGEDTTLAEAMERNYMDGVLVIQDGRVVVERYAGTLNAQRPHLLWSVSKTITGLVAASVANDGLIDLQRTVASYVPELASTGWGDNSLRLLLDMRDTSDWTEDYAAANSTVRRQDCADGLLTGAMCDDVPVVGNYVFLTQVGSDTRREGRFMYKSGTTDVIAWVLEAATGERFADLISPRLWIPMGAERSAAITVDVSGFTLASGGMMATLRDLGRVGLLMLNRGRVGDRQVVPAAWMEDLFSQPGDPNWPYPAEGDSQPYYRSFVWGLGDGHGTVQARGVHGQFIDVSPATNTVIAVFSSWPDADGGAPGVGEASTQAVIDALKRAVVGRHLVRP
ncbi:MAG: serine hydrolase [Congregibacter sp.]